MELMRNTIIASLSSPAIWLLVKREGDKETSYLPCSFLVQPEVRPLEGMQKSFPFQFPSAARLVRDDPSGLDLRCASKMLALGKVTEVNTVGQVRYLTP